MPTYEPPQYLRDALSEPIHFYLGGKQFELKAIPSSAVTPMREFVKLSDALNKSEAEDGDPQDTEPVHIGQVAEAAERFVHAVVGREIWDQVAPLDWRETLRFAQWLTPITCDGLHDGSEPEKNSEETLGESLESSAGTPKQ